MKKLFGLALVAGMVLATDAMATACAAGVTDKTFGPISFKTVTKSSLIKNDMCIAVIDADGELHNESVKIDTTITVDSVYYFRSNSAKSAKQTVVLPVTPTNSCKPKTTGANLSLIRKIYKNANGNWVALTNPVTTSGDGFKANYPYLMEFTETSGNVNFMAMGGCTFELNTTAGADTAWYSANPDPKSPTGLTGKWVFKGVYAKKTWEANDQERLVSYGFASKRTDAVAIGQFVKAGEHASVPPLRAYLVYDAKDLLKAAAGVVSSIDVESLPTTIEVIEEDEDGNTLSIGQMNTLTGEISVDENLWFDMKGRKFTHKPTIKGTYYNKGQKVIIK